VGGRALFTTAVTSHWIISVSRGFGWWLLVSVAELNLAATSGLFLLAVWASANLMLKTADIAPWPWEWGIKYNIFDWTHRCAYVGGFVLVGVPIEQIGQSL
jgi:hypothetical protein